MVTPTHPASARAKHAVTAARKVRPAWATAAEKSARPIAIESASMAMRKFFQPGRSMPRHQREMSEAGKVLMFFCSAYGRERWRLSQKYLNQRGKLPQGLK